jgi:hypothetical protein
MQSSFNCTYTQYNSVRHSIWMWRRASNSLDRPGLALCHRLLFAGRNWNRTSWASGEDFQKKKKLQHDSLVIAEVYIVLKTVYVLHINYMWIICVILTDVRNSTGKLQPSVCLPAFSYQSRRQTHLVSARFPKKKSPYELQAILNCVSPRNV